MKRGGAHEIWILGAGRVLSRIVSDPLRGKNLSAVGTEYA